MPKHNGHSSWNAWNVSLWINNDEALYHRAIDCKNRTKTIDDAARMFMQLVGEDAKTPDGGKYNLTCVRKALSQL